MSSFILAAQVVATSKSQTASDYNRNYPVDVSCLSCRNVPVYPVEILCNLCGFPQKSGPGCPWTRPQMNRPRDTSIVIIAMLFYLHVYTKTYDFPIVIANLAICDCGCLGH